MTTLDAATGLPELPEGQWWEVRKSPSHLYWGWQPYHVVIRETRTVQVVEQPGKHWWSKPTPATTETRAVDVASEGIDEHTLTPRLVRKAAYDLVQKRNRKARSDALLGAYPPKTLEAAK